MSIILGQNTVGLLQYKAESTYDGYTFVYPVNASHHFLINNCGEKIHEWKDDDKYLAGASAYFTEKGNLVKTKRKRDTSMDKIFAPGAGAFIEIRSWQNEVLWSYELNNDSIRLHHDFEIMPNGNILVLAWELKDKSESIQAGRDTATIPPIGIFNERILEINPTTNQIVWQWSAWDHLIQDFDQTKNNFGELKSNPQKININSNKGGLPGLPLSDWMHINSIDYNPTIDQIMISVPTFGEIYIIDHSTTSTQSSSSNGGLGKKGGDLLYRWGNESQYIKDNPLTQQLYFQHDARWILNVPVNHPDFGKISIFNNRYKADQSLPVLIQSPWDMYSWSYTKVGQTYGPTVFDKELSIADKAKQQSPITSSIQILPNNNVLMCAGAKGTVYEINATKEVVWEYKLPYKGLGAVDQGTQLAFQDNTIFNVYKFPKNFKGFEGKEFMVDQYVEGKPDSTYCDRLTSSIELKDEKSIYYPNPVKDKLIVEVDKVSVYDLRNINGYKITSFNLDIGQNILDISTLASGVYLLINRENISKTPIKILKL